MPCLVIVSSASDERVLANLSEYLASRLDAVRALGPGVFIAVAEPDFPHFKWASDG
jgi:hypothetical protein